jgi:hypothetical protein
VPDLPIAVVSLSFDNSHDRDFRLPGSGSRSLLYVFDGTQIGAQAETADGRDLTPGSSHDRVRLTFWDPAAAACVHPGGAFEIWYGGVIGHGSVNHLLPENRA